MRLNLSRFIDLTFLREHENTQQLEDFFQQAIDGGVAAVCVYPEVVPLAVKFLKNTAVKIATVANFPFGQDPIEKILNTISKALHDGAHEIDMVFPYVTYLSDDPNVALKFVETSKKLCGEHLLKVIIETGKLLDINTIKNISLDVILAGADFIKTSTGKVAVGATLPAAQAIIEVIKDFSRHQQKVVGLKVSGGIKTLAQAQTYVDLVIQEMGEAWLTPQHFRIGTSSLLTWD